MNAKAKGSVTDTPNAAHLLFALLGAPVAWAVHLLAGYVLIAAECSSAWRGADLAVGLLTLAAAAVAAGAGVLAHRLWRRSSGERPWDARLGERAARVPFLMVVGMFLAAIFTLAILLAGLSPLLAPTCAAGSALSG